MKTQPPTVQVVIAVKISPLYLLTSYPIVFLAKTLHQLLLSLYTLKDQPASIRHIFPLVFSSELQLMDEVASR